MKKLHSPWKSEDTNRRMHGGQPRDQPQPEVTAPLSWMAKERGPGARTDRETATTGGLFSRAGASEEMPWLL